MSVSEVFQISVMSFLKIFKVALYLTVCLKEVSKNSSRCFMALLAATREEGGLVYSTVCY